MSKEVDAAGRFDIFLDSGRAFRMKIRHHEQISVIQLRCGAQSSTTSWNWMFCCGENKASAND